MSNTREKIVEKALEMYNLYGIEYVGVRELAKELDMKGGNITYYFPTKNDLIMEISHRISEVNDRIFAEAEGTSMYHFLQVHRHIYYNQYEYRGVFLSLPLLLKQDDNFRAQYHKRQGIRKKGIYERIKSLFLAGYLQGTKIEQMDTILHAITMQNRLWIAEAALDNTLEAKEKTIRGYLEKLCGLLMLVASAKGKADIERFLGEIK